MIIIYIYSYTLNGNDHINNPSMIIPATLRETHPATRRVKRIRKSRTKWESLTSWLTQKVTWGENLWKNDTTKD